MKKIFFLITSIASLIGATSCSDTTSYADYVNNEKEAIATWIRQNPYNVEFGHIISKNEEWIKSINKSILVDSIHPCKFIELGQWYTLTETDYKRLYFRINSWGKDGVTDYSDEEQLKAAMRNRKKFYQNKNIMLRFDSLYILNDFNYDQPEKNSKMHNLEPNEYMYIFNWNTGYYANSYYSYYYGKGTQNECTSGGVAFPCRFLWEGGEASIICPFSIAESSFASSYLTLYYGEIKYIKPTFMPE